MIHLYKIFKAIAAIFCSAEIGTMFLYIKVRILALIYLGNLTERVKSTTALTANEG